MLSRLPGDVSARCASPVPRDPNGRKGDSHENKFKLENGPRSRRGQRGSRRQFCLLPWWLGHCRPATIVTSQRCAHAPYWSCLLGKAKGRLMKTGCLSVIFFLLLAI